MWTFVVLLFGFNNKLPQGFRAASWHPGADLRLGNTVSYMHTGHTLGSDCSQRLCLCFS